MKEKSQFGFIAIIGPTNAGKSTLMNSIIGRKVAIVSHKVQTTRTRLRAVKMMGPAQLVFVDTPGIFRPARALDKSMVSAAHRAFDEADAILLVIDAMHGITETVRGIIQKLKDKPNIFVALNKVDAVNKEKLLPMAANLMTLAPFSEIFMISALKNKGTGEMLAALARVLPAGPHMFDDADASDVPDNLFLAEMTREKVYQYLHQELPYQIHVKTDKAEYDAENVLEIYQTILVAKDSQKRIVVGAKGSKLQQIGTAARREIQDEWGVNARLRLFVKVDENWQSDAENYESQGLEFKK
ncbi:MAG: GTPase Era [Rickettsiales bacterium]|jgi:GTP-binding protein Era|nr:GTPase Era [Rickettsiales bacterium]